MGQTLKEMEEQKYLIESVLRFVEGISDTEIFIKRSSFLELDPHEIFSLQRLMKTNEQFILIIKQ